MNKRALLLLPTLVLALTACVQGNNSTYSTAPNSNIGTGFQASFSPLSGIGPFPNDLYFNGSTTGTLNIPVLPTGVNNPANAPTLAMNHLDGFSTQAVINAYFTAPVESASLNAGDVFVLKVASDPQNKAVNPKGTVTPLVQGANCSAPTADYTVGVSPATDSGGTVLNITPCKPLAPSTIQIVGGTPTPVPSTYLVVLTNGIKDTSGSTATPSVDYQAILKADLPVLSGGAMGTTGNPQLDQVAQFTLPQLAVAAGAGINPQNIVVTFSFSTQFVGSTLGAIAANAKATPQPQGVGIIDTGLATNNPAVLGSASPGLAEIYAGDVALPYYSAVPTASNPTAPLTGYWHTSSGGDTTFQSPMPAVTVAQNVIPILVTIPIASKTSCSMPASGWKTVIFQHGIGQDRENVFAVADALASQCFAAVAIDLPLHGITNTADPLYQKGHERTFDLPPIPPFLPAGTGIAPSGTYFINLPSLLTSRDNLREAVADLINLTATVPTLAAISGPPSAPTAINTFDGSQLYFVGHSLGGIVGATFLGVDGKHIVAATLANPGGDITQLLLNSQTFAPQIISGLAQEGIVQNTQFFFDFFRDAQTVIEDGDPANYAATAAANDPIHMIEVVGGFNNDPCNVPDTVVPNSSTNLLVNLMGLSAVNSNTGNFTTPVHAVVQFEAGDHGSILNPAPPSSACAADAPLYGAVTHEMQSEMVSFMASSGTFLQINNSQGFIK